MGWSSGEYGGRGGGGKVDAACALTRTQAAHSINPHSPSQSGNHQARSAISLIDLQRTTRSSLESSLLQGPGNLNSSNQSQTFYHVSALGRCYLTTFTLPPTHTLANENIKQGDVLDMAHHEASRVSLPHQREKRFQPIQQRPPNEWPWRLMPHLTRLMAITRRPVLGMLCF